MKKIFHIEEEISKETVKKFKSFLKTVEENETFYIRLNSWGGNSGSGKRIEGFIYYMKKYKSCKLVTEGVIASSVAFRIFIRGNERIIRKRHIIQLHLPVPRNKLDNNLAEVTVQQEKDITFIKAVIPSLTREEILEYNDIPLPLEFMIKKQIVTKVVSSF